jgi:hypothetical protein
MTFQTASKTVDLDLSAGMAGDLNLTKHLGISQAFQVMVVVNGVASPGVTAVLKARHVGAYVYPPPCAPVICSKDIAAAVWGPNWRVQRPSLQAAP